VIAVGSCFICSGGKGACCPRNQVKAFDVCKRARVRRPCGRLSNTDDLDRRDERSLPPESALMAEIIATSGRSGPGRDHPIRRCLQRNSIRSWKFPSRVELLLLERSVGIPIVILSKISAERGTMRNTEIIGDDRLSPNTRNRSSLPHLILTRWNFGSKLVQETRITAAGEG